MQMNILVRRGKLMGDGFENDENLDVLQNIEFAIIEAAREFSGTDDYDVMRALDTIIKDFRDIERNREPKPHSFEGATLAIFQRVMAICDWRMGKGPGPEVVKDETVGDASIPEPTPLPESTLSHCLKKIRKSVDRWHGIGGSRGYLEFVANYFPQGTR
jgi:hypothetical protein